MTMKNYRLIITSRDVFTLEMRPCTTSRGSVRSWRSSTSRAVGTSRMRGWRLCVTDVPTSSICASPTALILQTKAWYRTFYLSKKYKPVSIQVHVANNCPDLVILECAGVSLLTDTGFIVRFFSRYVLLMKHTWDESAYNTTCLYLTVIQYINMFKTKRIFTMRITKFLPLQFTSSY